jgi:hypothetical protein
VNQEIKRVEDRELRRWGLKFSFKWHDGKTIYAVSRKVARRVLTLDYRWKGFLVVNQASTASDLFGNLQTGGWTLAVKSLPALHSSVGA